MLDLREKAEAIAEAREAYILRKAEAIAEAREAFVRQESEARGRAEERIKLAKISLATGLDAEMVCRITGLSLAEVDLYRPS